MMKFTLGFAMMVSLGCASADGTPAPSPGAQQEPSDVESCQTDDAYTVSVTADGYDVSRRRPESASGGVRIFAEVHSAEGPPPFAVDFGDEVVEVRSDLTVCLTR